MTSQYVGNPANDPSSITILDDSDDWTAMNLALAPQALADSIAYLRQLVGSVGASWPHPVELWAGPKVPGVSLSSSNLAQPLNALGPGAGSGHDPTYSPTPPSWNDSVGANPYEVPLDLSTINGDTLNGVTVHVSGTSNGTATLALYKCGINSATKTQLGTNVTISSGSPSNTAYSVPSGLNLTEVIDTTAYVYLLEVTSSSGSGADPLGYSAPNVAYQSNGGAAPLRAPPVWDSAMGRWIAILSRNFTEPEAFQSFDGYAWEGWTGALTVSSDSVDVFGTIPRATDGTVLLLGYDATATAGVTFAISPSGTKTTNTGSPWVSRVTGNWASGTWLASGSTWVAWQGGGTVAPYSSPDGATWTAAASWAPPVSGFILHNQASFTAAFQGSTYAFIFPSGAQGTNPVGSYAVSSDGKNWTFYNMPTLNPGETVVDACYDSVAQAIYLITWTGTVTNVWQATTFTSWNLQASINRQCYGLRFAARGLTAWARYVGQGPSLGTVYRPIRSTDGGVTWSAPLGIGSSVAPTSYFSLQSSPRQTF
jgi:hypothetical protein